MKGGSQGIPATVDPNAFLPAYAYADFKHDFGGDKITANVLNDIETVGSRAEFFAKIQPLLGKSVFESFKPQFGLTIPGPLPDREYTEDALLGDVARIPYEIVSSVGGSVYDTTPEPQVFSIGGAIPRTYAISRVCEKVKANPSGYTAQLNTQVPPAGEYANLLSCLWAVSGKVGQRKKSFAIIYDAGNCATSEIGMLVNRSITEMVSNPGAIFGEEFDKTATYDVYFINSSENVRDPAPKIVERTFKSASKAPNVNVYFLNDYGHRSRYEMYSTRASESQTGNLYSRYTVTTVRDETGDKVRGTIDYEDGSSRQLDDVKRESEIESSTTNAIGMYLTAAAATPAVLSQMMSCFFLKRTGDWCQALCLLDKERVYKISGYGPKVGQETTLQKLEDENVEIMIMTHDRVLLAYAITLGLNVCFTNNRPNGHWIIYFKNVDMFRVDDVAQVLTSAKELVEQVKAKRVGSAAKRSECSSGLEKTEWIPVANIVGARRNAYILANLIDDEVFDAQEKTLRTFLAEIGTRHAEIAARLAAGEKLEAMTPEDKLAAKAYSDTLGKLRNLLPNIQSTVDITAKFTDPALRYPQQDEDEVTLNGDFVESFRGQRSFKASHKNNAGKQYNLEASITLIAERFSDDVKTSGAVVSNLPTDSDISNTAAGKYGVPRITRTQIAILRSVFDIFNKATASSHKAQVGGALTDLYWLPQAIYALTQISIPVVPPGSNPDTFGFEPGRHMIHYDRWKYMVVDPYIVTKEQQGTLVAAITNTVRADPAMRADLVKLPYIPYLLHRLLLLYVDVLYNEWLLVSPENNPKDAEEQHDVGEYVTPEEIYVRLLSQRVEFMKRLLNMFVPGFDILKIAQAISAYESGNMLEITASANPYASTLPDILAMYRFLLATPAPFGRQLYQIELRASTLDDGDSRYVVIYNPLTNVVVPYSYGPTAVFKGPQLIIPEGVAGYKFFQNIATNVYVPLIPQPNPEELQKTISAWTGGPAVMAQEAGGSHLGGRRPLYPNVHSPAGGSLPRRGIYEGLRQRPRSRHTYRVRQHTGGAQTRRQRHDLDRI